MKLTATKIVDQVYEEAIDSIPFIPDPAPTPVGNGRVVSDCLCFAFSTADAYPL